MITFWAKLEQRQGPGYGRKFVLPQCQTGADAYRMNSQIQRHTLRHNAYFIC